jgi:transcriptional regulator with XRE-family HTH domain
MTRNSKIAFTVHGSNRKEFVSRVKSILGAESARAFALRAGIAPTTFNKVANGESEPTRLTLLAIAEAAGVSLHWLIKGEGPKDIRQSQDYPDQNTLDSMNFEDQGRPAPLDQDLLMMIVEELENFRSQRNLKWDNKQKSRLITLGYAMMLAEREKGNQVGPEMMRYLMQAAS